ncbi:MAG: ABC transporter substrate-binding protein [Oligoflexia bacterium]|nr:ABC transporter substrate-binding protein [Oligoflexia bacterium]
MINFLLLVGMLGFMGTFPTQASQSLTIYTVMEQDEVPTYLEPFEKRENVKIKFVRLSAGETIARMEAEKKNPQATVWFGGPHPEFHIAKRKGLLSPYQPKTDFKLKDSERDNDWVYTGFYFGAIGFAVNEKLFKEKNLPVPKTWDDLLKPELKGQVTMAFPYTSGTAYTVVSALLAKHGDKKGWDYIKQLDSQVHHYNKSGSAAVTQVGLGEVMLGISFSNDILRKGRDAGYPVGLSIPKDGTASEIGCVGLIANSQNQELGKKFIDYALSLEVQNLLARYHRVPLHPKAKTPDESLVAKNIKLIKMDAEKVSENQKVVLDQWRKLTAK